MTIDRMECVVVGAGTAGAAVARRLAIAGREVMLIARPDWDLDDGNRSTPGSGWPEPVEAAILDRAGTLRADLRKRGAAALRSYCQLTGVQFAQDDQLVVARNAAEWKLLGDLKRRIDSSPATGQQRVELLDAAAVTALEPGLKCAGALLVGEAGIVDGDALRLNLRIDAENRGAFVTEESRLIAAYPMTRGFELDFACQPGELTTLRCDLLINASEEVEAYQIAARIDGMKPYMPAGMPPQRGKRYHLEGTAPFGRLVVPSCDKSEPSALFFSGFRGDSWLDVTAPRNENADWEIQTAGRHGIRGLVNVFGMDARSETTAALALTDAIIDGLEDRSSRVVFPSIAANKLVVA
jgi:L-2-hydroxyglutarate oxidase LhgO